MPPELLRLQGIWHKESDRGCALAAAAYLEARVEALLRGFLADTPPIVNQLLGGSGPLGSFSSQIDMAFCLGLISEAVHRDLHLIRKIRNEFAHSPDIDGFGSPQVRDRCSELRYNLFDDSASPREQYVRVCLFAAGAIRSAAHTLQRCVPPPSVTFDSEEARGLLTQLRDLLKDDEAGGL